MADSRKITFAGIASNAASEPKATPVRAPRISAPMMRRYRGVAVHQPQMPRRPRKDAGGAAACSWSMVSVPQGLEYALQVNRNE